MHKCLIVSLKIISKTSKIHFTFRIWAHLNNERTDHMGILTMAKKRRRTAPDERRELLLALDEAGRRRDAALRYFDSIEDDHLIVSAVHELESAAAQYTALLRQAKNAGIRRTFLEAQAMKRECPEPEKVP